MARTKKPTLAACLDARPWIDVTGDGEVPPYMMLERIPRPNDGIGPGGMQAVWDGAQETMKSIDEDRSGD